MDSGLQMAAGGITVGFRHTPILVAKTLVFATKTRTPVFGFLSLA